MLKELLNGNYYIYQLSDGGCGIVKANTKEEAIAIVIDAYKTHGIVEVDKSDIDITKIQDGLFDDAENVIELGMSIEFN